MGLRGSDKERTKENSDKDPLPSQQANGRLGRVAGGTCSEKGLTGLIQSEEFFLSSSFIPLAGARTSCSSMKLRDKKRVCIIGAGPSGLATAVALLDRGLLPIIFEQSNEIGGTWRYEIPSNFSHSSAYLSLTANTHKKLMEFKSFPMPASYPDYPTRKQVFEYLKCYAKRNGLNPCIRFHSRVLKLYPLSDDRWNVIYQKGEELLSDVFDAVAVILHHRESSASSFFLSPLTTYQRCIGM